MTTFSAPLRKVTFDFDDRTMSLEGEEAELWQRNMAAAVTQWGLAGGWPSPTPQWKTEMKNGPEVK